jgi:hypothetical protein
MLVEERLHLSERLPQPFRELARSDVDEVYVL